MDKNGDNDEKTDGDKEKDNVMEAEALQGGVGGGLRWWKKQPYGM